MLFGFADYTYNLAGLCIFLENCNGGCEVVFACRDFFAWADCKPEGCGFVLSEAYVVFFKERIGD